MAVRDPQSPDAPWRDAGGIMFNHAVHLAPQGVLGPDRTPQQLATLTQLLDAGIGCRGESGDKQDTGERGKLVGLTLC